MATLNPIVQCAAKDRYWQLVQRTVTEVFGQPYNDELNAEIEHLQRTLANAPTAEQAQFFHAEPLDVAADLVQQTPTPEQVQNYLTIAKDCIWDLHP